MDWPKFATVTFPFHARPLLLKGILQNISSTELVLMFECGIIQQSGFEKFTKQKILKQVYILVLKYIIWLHIW